MIKFKKKSCFEKKESEQDELVLPLEEISKIYFDSFFKFTRDAFKTKFPFILTIICLSVYILSIVYTVIVIQFYYNLTWIASLSFFISSVFGLIFLHYKTNFKEYNKKEHVIKIRDFLKKNSLYTPQDIENLIVHFQNNIRKDLTKTDASAYLALAVSCIVALNNYVPTPIIINSLGIIGLVTLTFSITQSLIRKPKHHKHAYLLDTLENILFTLNSDENEKNI
ncbi:hypothetical protein [Brochothrix thermosphacta]|uniref:Uncharacterized protein n=3 Tax=Brochothrix thermosphacta TaxID=2756 RepID=A0A1D2KSW1_BROTH|nr:hypothetical protein [Brochothrix thermosphacta]ATF25137.1 hypothetical protein CNY62_01375 [Brochothrix thermosphacta]ATH84520.1 hypothetical protein CPF12_01205 [Brochothrix thermosphacta]MPQ27568.1 hypothetical protein [Brochothrix thermosphacta]ODJ55841.1 hypothetical protein BFR38_07625 [Brochothrix thermosphacta]ODJ60822.1 hypothetical protein BFR42_02585 [Brochothrix thermosphacta]